MLLPTYILVARLSSIAFFSRICGKVKLGRNKETPFDLFGWLFNQTLLDLLFFLSLVGVFFPFSKPIGYTE